MKSRAVTEARSHFSLFKTSSSICCEDRSTSSGETRATGAPVSSPNYIKAIYIKANIQALDRKYSQD